MYSICTACEKGFYRELNRRQAWQLPGVECPEYIAPEICIETKCKYFFDEGIDYGCTDFILCDDCLKDPNAIREMLRQYEMISGF